MAAELTVTPPAASAGRTVADALDAWLETHIADVGGVDGAGPDEPGVAGEGATRSPARRSGVSPWPTSIAGTPACGPHGVGRVVVAQPAPRAAGRAVAGRPVGLGDHERGRAGHPRPAHDASPARR